MVNVKELIEETAANFSNDYGKELTEQKENKILIIAILKKGKQNFQYCL